MAIQTSIVKETEHKRSLFSRLLPVILILTGVVVLLYPVITTAIRNLNQSTVASSYSQEASDPLVQAELAASLQAAMQWNNSHSDSPILDPWLARIDEDNDAYRNYLEQLSVFNAMGRIVIPTINSDLPIYHGTAEETLQRGIGHLFGSSLPVGGEGEHSVFTGHTGLSEATLWDNLNKVEVGDPIYIDSAGQRTKYEVYGIEVVLPSEVESLSNVPGRDLVTLITCTPYGVNSHRLLVHAERVPLDPEEIEEVFSTSHIPWQWWMTVAVVVAAMVLLALLIALSRRIRSQRQDVMIAGEK